MAVVLKSSLFENIGGKSTELITRFSTYSKDRIDKEPGNISGLNMFVYTKDKSWPSSNV